MNEKQMLKEMRKMEKRFWKSRGPYRDGSKIQKKLKEELHTGDWSGRRCWILGGGPSLRGFDWKCLRGELTIGINKAFLHYDPTLIFSADYRFYKKLMMFNQPKRERLYEDEELCEWARNRYLTSPAHKVWLDTEGGAFGSEVSLLDYPGYDRATGKRIEIEEGVSFRLEEGIYQGRNSGYAALNLAIALGASPIILLGFDMVGRGGKAAWFHDGYQALSSWQRTEECYDRFLEQFRRNFFAINNWGEGPNLVTGEWEKKVFAPITIIKSKPDLPTRRIYNLSFDSALDCIAFPHPSHVALKRHPLYVSYYTNHHYWRTSQDLKKSLHRHGLDYEIDRVEDRGSWQANTSYKPEFILQKMLQHPDRDIVWLDADSIVQGFPGLFEDDLELKRDIMYYIRPGRSLCSGTLYIKNTDKMINFVADWISRCEDWPDTWEQQVLQFVVENWKQKLFTRELPETYCKIFDSQDQCKVEDAVITHWQESRNQKRRERDASEDA